MTGDMSEKNNDQAHWVQLDETHTFEQGPKAQANIDALFRAGRTRPPTSQFDFMQTMKGLRPSVTDFDVDGESGNPATE